MFRFNTPRPGEDLLGGGTSEIPNYTQQQQTPRPVPLSRTAMENIYSRTTNTRAPLAGRRTYSHTTNHSRTHGHSQWRDWPQEPARLLCNTSPTRETSSGRKTNNGGTASEGVSTYLYSGGYSSDVASNLLIQLPSGVTPTV